MIEPHNCLDHLVKLITPKEVTPKAVWRRKPRYCEVCLDIYALAGHRGPYVPVGTKLRTKETNDEVFDEEVYERGPSELPKPM